MKSYIVKIVSLWHKVFLFFFYKNQEIYSAVFYLPKITIAKKNTVNLNKSRFISSSLVINGEDNTFSCGKCEIINSKVTIAGSNNRIQLADNVRFTGELIIRGTNCKIIIEENTTFGGVRIVNVGVDNDVKIGKNCMFSDFIEIWASDSHTIYNKEKVQVNPEKPIFIGDHVWVGSRAIILKGTNIGSNSIIGMGCMVTKDITSNSISVGVTNKQIATDVFWDVNYKTQK